MIETDLITTKRLNNLEKRILELENTCRAQEITIKELVILQRRITDVSTIRVSKMLAELFRDVSNIIDHNTAHSIEQLGLGENKGQKFKFVEVDGVKEKETSSSIVVRRTEAGEIKISTVASPDEYLTDGIENIVVFIEENNLLGDAAEKIFNIHSTISQNVEIQPEEG